MMGVITEGLSELIGTSSQKTGRAANTPPPRFKTWTYTMVVRTPLCHLPADFGGRW